MRLRIYPHLVHGKQWYHLAYEEHASVLPDIAFIARFDSLCGAVLALRRLV